MKKFAALVLSLLFLISSSNTITALGAEKQRRSEIITPLYENTNIINAQLQISGQNAICNGLVKGKNFVNKIEVEMTLQKKTLLWWSKVETWSKVEYNSLVEVEKSHLIENGTYRVKISATVYNGDAKETVDAYSAEKKK